MFDTFTHESFHPAFDYPNCSRRTVVYGRHGMVSTTQPLAAQAGLRVLQEGGNAIDAAVATAAALTVVEPTSNGLGSDAFAIVWSQGRLWGLNASGPAPAKLTPEWVQSLGHREEMPSYGWGAVTIPGAPAAWAALSQRFGSLTLKDTLKPAIQLAQEGFPVSPVVAYFWARAYERFSEQLSGPEFREWFRIFAPMGRAPYPGEIWASPDHARTLEEIGQRPDSYYHGQLADQIVQFSQRTGGVLTKDDLETFQPEWVSPIAVNFQGYDIWELPPNGQGLVALMALKMLAKLNPQEDEEWVHDQIEAIKLGFSDAYEYLADPRYMNWSAEAFLDDEYLDKRRQLIGPQAMIPKAGKPMSGGTVYLAAADHDGNMVSYIQSNFAGFGSGLVVPGTGISLQNRGRLFSLQENHPNYLLPGKRPYHTIIPGFLTYGGQPIGPFGVMGGFMQPQGHVQVLANLLRSQLNPQAALDAPRFYWESGRRVVIEHTMPQKIVESLRQRGHDVELTAKVELFGRGQIIWRNDDGVLMGGSEPRADGHIAVF